MRQTALSGHRVRVIVCNYFYFPMGFTSTSSRSARNLSRETARRSRDIPKIEGQTHNARQPPYWGYTYRCRPLPHKMQRVSNVP